MASLGSFFGAILAKLGAIVQWVIDLVLAVFVSMWDLFKDVISWCFESVLDVATTAISGIDVTGLNGFAASGWGALPGEIVNALGLLGVGTAITIITTAIGIRLMLQLIPFTRLGS